MEPIKIVQGDPCKVTKVQAYEHWMRTGLRVRICSSADEPRLFEHFLAAEWALRMRCRTSAWDYAYQTACVLLETASDQILPLHWRTLSADHLHRPLTTLDTLRGNPMQERHVKTLRWALARLEIDGMTATVV